MSTYDHNLTWEISRVVGITSISMYFNFLVVASERHLMERTGDLTVEGKHLLLHLFLIWRPGALLVDLGRVIIENKSI